MVDRLNNSTGALNALRYLQKANQDLSGAETRVSSGLRVASARHDANAYHAAETMRGQTSSLSAVALSLGRAESISDTAIAAGEQVSKLLIEMQATATAAMGEDLSDAQRAEYAQMFATQLDQLARFIANASFDDANLLDGSRPLGVSFIADSEANHMVTLAGRNFLPAGPVVTIGPPHALDTVAGARLARDAIADSIANVGDQLQEMVAERKRIEAQKGFVSRLADALAAGIGRMVDADLAAESALIQALQVRQELSAASVSIANSAPQALLSLLRG